MNRVQEAALVAEGVHTFLGELRHKLTTGSSISESDLMELEIDILDILDTLRDAGAEVKI